jgi:hypothetical protein
MDIQNLIESLKKHHDAIGDETIQKMDFDRLQEDLIQASSALHSLEEKERLCEKLLTDYKSEIRKMALAISRMKGDSSSCGLVEKLLSSPEMSFEDLLFLKEKVKEEFNQSFPSSPQSRTIVSLPELRFDSSEFKTGVRS